MSLKFELSTKLEDPLGHRWPTGHSFGNSFKISSQYFPCEQTLQYDWPGEDWKSPGPHSMADIDSDGHLFPASFEFKIVWINFYDINYITGRMLEIENSHLDRESCLAPQFYFLVDNNIQTDRADWGLRVKNLSHEPFINESLNYCSLSFKYF